MLNLIPKKIIVTGNGGAGKSLLAKRLGSLFNYPVTYLDKLYWHDGWKIAPLEYWEENIARVIKKEQWIIEGVQLNDLRDNIRFADMIILLDKNHYSCVWGVIKKGIINLFKKQEEIEDGCPVKGISWRAIKWVWNYPKETRPINLQRLKQFENQVLILHNDEEIEELIKKFTMQLNKI